MPRDEDDPHYGFYAKCPLRACRLGIARRKGKIPVMGRRIEWVSEKDAELATA